MTSTASGARRAGDDRDAARPRASQEKIVEIDQPSAAPSGAGNRDQSSPSEMEAESHNQHLRME